MSTTECIDSISIAASKAMDFFCLEVRFSRSVFCGPHDVDGVVVPCCCCFLFVLFVSQC